MSIYTIWFRSGIHYTYDGEVMKGALPSFTAYYAYHY